MRRLPRPPRTQLTRIMSVLGTLRPGAAAWRGLNSLSYARCARRAIEAERLSRPIA